MDKLTERELEVMELFANPYLEKAEICAQLCISMNTLNTHIQHIFAKLDETERFAAVFKFFCHYPAYKYLLDQYIVLAS